MMNFLRVFRYECFKTYRNVLLVLLFIAALVANAALFYEQQYQRNSILLQNRAAYDKLVAVYKDQPIDAAISEISVLKKKYDVFIMLEMLTLSQNSVPGIDEQVNELLHTNPEEVKAYNDKSYPQFSGNLDADYYLISKVYGDISHVATYEDYLNTIDAQASDMTGFSIFSQNNSFSKKNIVKTASEFDRLHGVVLKYDNTESVSNAVSFSTTDIFALLTLLVLCIVLIAYEKDRGLFDLLLVNRYGRAHIVVSKLLMILLNSAIVAALFYGSDFVIANAIYGNCDTNILLQSIPMFKQCTIAMSVKTYIFIHIAFKASALACISLIFMVLLLYMKNTVISYAVIAVLLAASYLLYRYIDTNSYLNYFKYINTAGILDTTALFADYQNLNFFGIPMGVKSTSLALILALIATVSAACVYGFLKSIRVAVRFLQKLYDVVIRKMSHIWLQHSIFLYELLRMLFANKGFVVILILVLFEYSSLSNSFVFFDRDAKVYQSYIQQWGGLFTQETVASVEKEQAFFDSIGEQINKLKDQLNSHKITQAQYDGMSTKLNFYSEKMAGFSRIKQQVADLSAIQRDTGIVVWLIDDTGYNRLFAVRSFGEDAYNMLLAILAVVILLAASFSYDNQKRIGHLFSACAKGTRALARNRILVAALGTIGVALIVFGAQIIDVARLFGMPGLQAPIQSITAFGRLPFHMTILQYVIITNMLRMITLLLVMMVTLAISGLSSNIPVSMVISATVSAITVIIYMNGVQQIANYSLVSPMSANMLFLGVTRQNWAASALWPAVIFLLLAFLFIFISKRGDALSTYKKGKVFQFSK